MKSMNNFVESFDTYLHNINLSDEKNNKTIQDDFKYFKETKDFNSFLNSSHTKSNLFYAMYNSSCKMTNIIFNMQLSKGPILIYSNQVMIEGLQIIKIYLKHIKYSPFNSNLDGNDYLRYTEFTGNIDKDIRVYNVRQFNEPENFKGKHINVILLSPAGTEGINLFNIRQVHILEPYWDEVRTLQLIGRSNRSCGHKLLPVNERIVDIFRYHIVRNPIVPSKAKLGRLTID
jgi:hypothetical protein